MTTNIAASSNTSMMRRRTIEISLICSRNHTIIKSDIEMVSQEEVIESAEDHLDEDLNKGG